MTKFHEEFPYFVHLSKTWPHGGLPNQIVGGVRKKVGGVNAPWGGCRKIPGLSETADPCYSMRWATIKIKYRYKIASSYSDTHGSVFSSPYDLYY